MSKKTHNSYKQIWEAKRSYKQATDNLVTTTYAGIGLALYRFFHDDNNTSEDDTCEIIQKIFDDGLYFMQRAERNGKDIVDELEERTGIVLKDRAREK